MTFDQCLLSNNVSVLRFSHNYLIESIELLYNLHMLAVSCRENSCLTTTIVLCNRSIATSFTIDWKLSLCITSAFNVYSPEDESVTND